MKKINSVLGLCAAAALAFGMISCTKVTPETANPSEEPGMVKISFTATLDNESGTVPGKASIDDKNVVWQAGDQIGLFAFKYIVREVDGIKYNLGEETNWPYQAASGGARAGVSTTGAPNYTIMSDPLPAGGSSTATFTFTIPAADQSKVTEADYYVAVYPFRYRDQANDITYYNCIADRRTGSTNNYTRAYLRYSFYGEQTNATAQISYAISTNNTLTFKNLSSIVHFETSNAAIKKAVLTGAHSEELGYSSMKYTFESEAFAKLNADATAYTSIINTNVQVGHNYFALMPGVTLPDGFKIVLYDENDVELSEFRYPSSYTTARNKLSTITNFDDRAARNLEGEVNCYIVTSPNTRYCFNPGARTTTADIASVSVLWETENLPSGNGSPLGRIVTNPAIGSDGNIYFSTPDNTAQGNALLAARDANGVILWSWHIWRLNSAPADVTITNNHGDQAVFLDRNLGAVSADPADGYLTFGLYYQWGSKNPIPGNGGACTWTGSSDSFNTFRPSSYTVNGSSYTIGSTISANTYQYLTSLITWPCSLLTTTDATTSAPVGDAYWNFYQSGYDITPKKGANDPCPYGYAVSPGVNHSSSTGSSATSTYAWWAGGNANETGTGNYRVTTFPYGFYIDGSYYPLAGSMYQYANNKFGYNYNGHACYWVSVGSNYCFSFHDGDTLYYPTGNNNATRNYREACSVRCQKIQ